MDNSNSRELMMMIIALKYKIMDEEMIIIIIT
jgi:hypothetical protein